MGQRSIETSLYVILDLIQIAFEYSLKTVRLNKIKKKKNKDRFYYSIHA